VTVSVHMVDHFGTAVQDYIGTCTKKLRYIGWTTSVHLVVHFGTSISVHC